ncbi:MAG: hypothetical protein GX096_05040 [Clostridiales bacterium]|nr:hypothetical protein [Clostridiales bacterium]
MKATMCGCFFCVCSWNGCTFSLTRAAEQYFADLSRLWLTYLRDCIKLYEFTIDKVVIKISNVQAHQNGKGQVQKKISLLFADKRSYRDRLLLALAAHIAVVFTFLFFGPFEITVASADSISYTIVDTLTVMGLVSIIALICLTFLLPLLKGRFFNYILTCEFSMLLCGYIQGNFLNGEMGILDGNAISWVSQRHLMLLNLVIMLVIFLIPYLVLYLRYGFWKKMVRYVSLLLVVMQLVAMGTLMPSVIKLMNQRSYYLSTENMYTYSEDENVFVFVLDRLDYDVVKEVEEFYEGFFEMFDGFTCYTNATSEFARTNPAIHYMLTNDEGAFRMHQWAYLNNSWSKDNLLSDIASHDYSVNVYTDMYSAFGGNSAAMDYVDNMKVDSKKVDRIRFAEKMLTLSSYRYAPIACKPFYHLYTDDINNDIFLENDLYAIDEAAYSENFNQLSLTSGNAFKFFHFNGSHSPYTLDEDGMRSDVRTDVYRQTIGSFTILFEIFREMKESGIYQDATIIILGDHGIPVSDLEPLTKATHIGFFYKPAGEIDTELQYSSAPISQKNIPATLAQAVGLDYEKYGVPIDQVAEGAEVERFFYKSVVSYGRHESDLYIYQIHGDSNNFDNYELIEILDIGENYFY